MELGRRLRQLPGCAAELVSVLPHPGRWVMVDPLSGSSPLWLQEVFSDYYLTVVISVGPISFDHAGRRGIHRRFLSVCA